MITKRIIACLDVHAGRVVKGVQFVDIIDAGDPAALAASIFHFGVSTSRSLKEELAAAGVPVRLPC